MRKAAAPVRNGVVVPHPPTSTHRVIAWFIHSALWLVSKTLRGRLDDRSGMNWKDRTPAIFCVWHNRLALCIFAYDIFGNSSPTRRKMAAMASASRDGGFLCAILDRFGVLPVRGSSSRRGRQALLELTTLAKRGMDLAITPDGPRGPRYVIQDGVIALAQITGLPIIPFSYDLGWKITIKSWDRFMIPLPFSRWDMVVAPPITVPREASEEDRARYKKQLEDTLRAISKE